MAKTSGLLKKMQAKHEHEAKVAATLSDKWAKQAAVDSLVLTMGYGKTIGRRPWGAMRIKRFVDEWVEIWLWVIRGYEGEPDSDAIRKEVDELLKKKVPPELYMPWFYRYVGFVEKSIEEERADDRPKWKRDGMDTDGSTTEDLLRDLRGGC